MYQYLIALGSNLGNRTTYIEDAIQKIAKHGTITTESPLYLTKPIGAADQEFINGAIIFESALPPFEILKSIQEVEKKLGRARTQHWGNRTIDLDIIFAYQDGKSLKYDDPHLKIPHPEALKRDFVMVPLAVIAPNFIIESESCTIKDWVQRNCFSLTPL